MDNIEAIIRKKEEIIALLRELKASHEYFKCSYHLVQTDKLGRYSLIRISDHDIVRHGDIERIESYINFRSIPADTVYDYNKYIKTI
jgi:hypothetical protein